MSSGAAPLVDRVLHARAEVLLRRAVREGFTRLTEAGRTPLVVVGDDRSRHERWVAGGDPALLAAVADELDPVAAGCLLVVRAEGREVVGTAVTVTALSARAFTLDATVRRFGGPQVSLGRQQEPAGAAAEIAVALLEALERAERVRNWT